MVREDINAKVVEFNSTLNEITKEVNKLKLKENTKGDTITKYSKKEMDEDEINDESLNNNNNNLLNKKLVNDNDMNVDANEVCI